MMNQNIKTLYQAAETKFSLEVFPPKTEEKTKELFKELQTILNVVPISFISVTYGAMGTTQNKTKELVLQIKKTFQIPVAYHFTCVGTSKANIDEYVSELLDNGIDNIVALRGDRPKDNPNFRFDDFDFSYAGELVTYLQKFKELKIAVAGYPEKHIEAPSLEIDLQHTKEKVDAGADIIITQLFYSNKNFYDYQKQLHNLNVNIPILAGIMPVKNLTQIQKISQMCGAVLPNSLVESLKSAENSPKQMIEIGIEHATNQCKDLIQNHIKGIHFYGLNQSYSVIEIYKRLQEHQILKL